MPTKTRVTILLACLFCLAHVPAKAHEEPAKTKMELQDDEQERLHFERLGISTITIRQIELGKSTDTQKDSLFAVYQLNKAGEVTRQEYYAPDGHVKAAVRLVYDINHRMTEQATLHGDGTVADRIVWSYDENGLLSGYKAYDGSNSILASFQYAREKNRIICSKTDKDGKPVYTLAYTYSGDIDAGKELAIVRTQHPDIVDTKVESSYDGSGHRIEKRVYGKDGKISFTWHFAYDEKGHRIETVKLMPDGAKASTQRHVFNADGDETTVTEYDAKGVATHRLEYQYQKYTITDTKPH